jgi:hypothetical protein
MDIIVVYPGRFHPFHRGHKASYEYLVTKFGENNVYIATSDVQAPLTSPFSYADKVAMMTKLGIPASHIVQVKNPYQVKEITSSLPDPENTALIYAISEKDMQGDGARFKFGIKKNGEASYMQPMPENIKKLKPLTKHAYVVVTPTVNFRVKGVDANSASAVRKLYIDGNDQDRTNIITDLYGAPDADLQAMFDKKLGVTEKVTEIYYEARRSRNQVVLERLLVLEQQAHNQHQVLTEDLVSNTDYIDEKISR